MENRIDTIEGLNILEQIGEGGMSTVWKAWDESRGKHVALKMLKRANSENLDDIRSLLIEEQVMREIHHPGIIEAYDARKIGHTWYLIMEYVDGYTISDLLRRKQHLSEQDCLLICESVASALNHAWNDHGIVHCDLKPENLMINSQGMVKIADLGISYRYAFREDGVQDVPEHVSGTPAYISPEQIYGDVELDCRTDIYSLAATLYHLSTGRLLFPCLDNESTMRTHCDEQSQAYDPRNYMPTLTEGFAQLLEAMLVKNRDSRLQSWIDVYEMCRLVESGTAFKPRDTPGNSSIRLNVRSRV